MLGSETRVGFNLSIRSEMATWLHSSLSHVKLVVVFAPYLLTARGALSYRLTVAWWIYYRCQWDVRWRLVCVTSNVVQGCKGTRWRKSTLYAFRLRFLIKDSWNTYVFLPRQRGWQEFQGVPWLISNHALGVLKLLILGVAGRWNRMHLMIIMNSWHMSIGFIS